MNDKRVLFFIFFVFWFNYLNAQLYVEAETGIVVPGYNDVRIPADGGTQFSLSHDLSGVSQQHYRFEVGYIFGSRHTVSLLYAPLEVQSKGSLPTNVNFDNIVFPANTELVGTYKFNSYRLTYRYDIIKGSKFEFGLGFTAKIRDARIALESVDVLSAYTDFGFVPIINFRFLYRVNNTLGVLLKGDALGAKQGRAEDVLFALTYKVGDHFSLNGGYRILEGGSDGSKVYTFALFNYAVFGARFSF